MIVDGCFLFQLSGPRMDGAACPSSRLSADDIEAISGVCCSLMRAGRIQGVVRVEGEDDRIVCVAGDQAHLFGIGKNSRGRYFVFNANGSAIVEGWRLQDVIKALSTP